MYHPLPGRPVSPFFVITPVSALVDEPVTIQLFHLPPAQPVTIRATTSDDHDRVWSSSARFQSDALGSLDLGLTAPLDGSYAGADAMGLFWSMLPLTPSSTTGPYPFAKISSEPLEIIFTAEVAGDVLAVARAVRLFCSPDVVRIPVHADGVVGTFFVPSGPGPYPAVICLSGSSGSIKENDAALLASHGYCTLALAYFGSEFLPSGLVEIPLEYFLTAIRWLQSSPFVTPEHIAIMGISKGAEAALLLAATFPALTSVIAYAPSSVVWEGLPATEADVDKSSWSLRGSPLPFLPYNISVTVQQVIDAQKQADLPVSYRPLYLTSLTDQAGVERATIPVEQIQGPILLISGRDDQMWPSNLSCDLLTQRLAAHAFPHPYQHLSYPDAGHKIAFPYLPTTLNQLRHPVSQVICDYGGSPAGMAYACAHSWSAILTFLAQHNSV